MSVVHVYAGYVASRTEGITRNVQGLVDALARRGEDVRLEEARVELADLNRMSVHARNARRGRRLVRRASGQDGVELVHHHVNIAAMGLASRSAHRRKRVLVHVWNAVYRRPEVARAGSRRGRWKQRLFNGPRAARWGLAAAPEVAVSSRFQAAQLRSIGYEGVIHMVPNGVDTAEFRPSTATQQAAARARLGVGGEPAVLYYGHLSAWKGTEDVVDAFAGLVREHPRAQLVIAHTPYGRGAGRLRNRIDSLGIASRVRLLGLSHVPTLLAACDVVVVPPVAAVGSACHPNVLLESLAAGKPVVATSVGSIPEAVRDGETGLLVPPADPATLAQALGRLAEDDGLRRGLAHAARGDVLARFDWDVVARRFQEVYHGRAPSMGRPGPAIEGRGARQPGVEAWA